MAETMPNLRDPAEGLARQRVKTDGHVDNDGDMDIVYGDVDVYKLLPGGLSGLSQLLISQQPGNFSMSLSEGSATSPARTGLYVVAKLRGCLS